MLLPALLLALGLLLIRAPTVQAAPAAQGVPGASPQLYLLPQDASTTDVVLETHIATIRLLPTGDGAAVDTQYILRNPTDEAVTVPVRLLPGGDRSLGPAQGVSLTNDGDPVPLAADDDGGYSGDLYLAVDGRLSLHLVYQVALGDGPLVAIRYVPAVLNTWPGNISLRVELVIPDAIPPESWIQTTPSTWRYSPIEEADVTEIHWLYDFSAPDVPFRFQFVAPTVWAAIVPAEAAATGNAAITDFVQLGNLYRDLARAANDAAVRERFHAQAVAAYQGGLSSAGWGLASSQEKASVYLGLADLYRARIVDADAAEQTTYAELLVEATTQALALLPDDDAHRYETTLWQVDGLHLLLNQALARREWPTALVYLDRLTAMPGNLVNPTQLAEERDAILIQQALQLMAQGNRDAALAVAGDLIAADALVPPTEAASLFVGWQITVTATPGKTQMVIVGLTTPDRADAATSRVPASRRDLAERRHRQHAASRWSRPPPTRPATQTCAPRSIWGPRPTVRCWRVSCLRAPTMHYSAACSRNWPPPSNDDAHSFCKKSCSVSQSTCPARSPNGRASPTGWNSRRMTSMRKAGISPAPTHPPPKPRSPPPSRRSTIAPRPRIGVVWPVKAGSSSPSASMTLASPSCAKSRPRGSGPSPPIRPAKRSSSRPKCSTSPGFWPRARQPWPG